ncbi:MAG: insulinase family protein [Cyanobacteria bacterium P01_H01_bin.15]
MLTIFCWCFFGFTSPAPALSAASDASIAQAIANVTEFRLDNGLKFIVYEDRQAPVVSFVTYADVGGVDEPDGKTGVAHFLEHLAFKGTTRIGITDAQKEDQLLKKSDAITAELEAAKLEGNTTKMEALTQQLVETEAAANELVIQNEFGQIVEAAGGKGLNAATSADYTMYFYNFPANKLELWMSLESERFLEPVFREFYKEKEVILEERRLRTDNSPLGKMIEVFLGEAFSTHPYRRPVIGYEPDIRNLSREDVSDFFATHYIPAKLTIAIAGDVDPVEVKRLAEIYFGRYAPKALPDETIAVEPKQTEARTVTIEFPAQPQYLLGFHRPSIMDPDNAAYDVLAAILSNGRLSRLYKSLVQEQQVALTAQGFSGFPGDKYPNLLLFYASTAPGRTLDEVAVALEQEIDRLKTEPISEAELRRVQKQLRASILRQLDSNAGLARLLATYQVQTGDWRNLFNQLDAIGQVTPVDVQRIAQQTFTAANRTTARLFPPTVD